MERGGSEESIKDKRTVAAMIRGKKRGGGSWVFACSHMYILRYLRDHFAPPPGGRNPIRSEIGGAKAKRWVKTDRTKWESVCIFICKKIPYFE